MDFLHRILSGQTLTRRELHIAGWFVVAWFILDLVEWVDWLIDKVWR
jgi:hypothetical protein